MFERRAYMDRLIECKDNGSIKILTGITGVGKSHLLERMYNHLLETNVSEDNIIRLDLEKRKFADLKSADDVLGCLDKKISDNHRYYLFIDELQKISDFEDLLIELSDMENVDIYVAGSNCKLASAKLKEKLCGNLEHIHVYPLSFLEFYEHYRDANNETDKYLLLENYMLFGGLPRLCNLETEGKKEYLENLLYREILTAIVEQNNMYNKRAFGRLVDLITHHCGNATTVYAYVQFMKQEGFKGVTDKTLKKYIGYLINAHLLNPCRRYNLKDKTYSKSSSTLYFEDVGLYNVMTHFFPKNEWTRLKNILFNELKIRGYNVNFVSFWAYGKEDGVTIKYSQKIDFIAKITERRYYIELCANSKEQITNASKILSHIRDSFKKIILVHGKVETTWDEKGVMIMSVFNFLTDKNSMNL